MSNRNRIIFLVLAAFLAPTAALASEAVEPGLGMTHRMMILVIQLGIILFMARLGNALFERFRMPGVLGEILAGVLVGPYLLGALALPGFPEGLFPLGRQFPVSPELYGICAIAAVVLLFVVGLETDINLFMRYSVAGSLVGIGGVSLSFILGDLTTVMFSPLLFGRQLDFLSPPCLFLGIVSTATSVGISARILAEQRQLKSPEGVTILSGAVVDDVLGIVLLAVGLGVISASRGTGMIDWSEIGRIAAKAMGIWIAATVIGLLASRRISTLLKLFGDRSSIATMALGLALILAGLFEEAGLAMIIGAYVVGLSLSRTDINQVIQEKLDPIYAFLVPVFFTVMGMLVDVRLLASGEVLLFGVIYTVIAGFAKIVGCGIPALSCNFNLRGALRVGFGMLPRGEVALIIAGVGLASGLLNQETFGVAIFMTLVTTLIALPGLVAMFSSPASGVRKEIPESAETLVPFQLPSAETAELLTNKLLDIFEEEGYFVHSIGHQEGMHQLRKDSLSLTLSREGTTLTFSCGRAEIPFLNAAMYEVLAELEEAISELRKPIDRKAIVRKLQQRMPGSMGRASLKRYMSRRVLIPKLGGTTKEEIIEELLEVLRGNGVIKDFDDALQAVWSREKSMSTGMQYGIAIPHGRTDAVDRLVCAVGLKPEGVDFDSIDGQPTRIVVLTLTPKSAAAPHVQFMSTVSQILDESGREALLFCETAEEMYSVLTGQTSSTEMRALRKQQRRKSKMGATREFGARLRQILGPELIRPDLKGASKADVIEEMLRLLQERGLLHDLSAARAAVLEREEQIATGLEHGVAIPHARTNAVDRLVCAFGVKKDGVDFGAADAEPSRIVVLTLSPQDAPTPHVQFMSMIARILNEEGREGVLQAETAEEMWNVLLSQVERGRG